MDFIVSTYHLVCSVILNNNLHYLELKSISSIIITYLPSESRTQEEIESYALWLKFSRFLARSNRRTSMHRLATAAQKMGREFPKLAGCCDSLINKLYNLIRGETGKILDNIDRREWENSLESKPLKYFRVGDKLFEKL